MLIDFFADTTASVVRLQIFFFFFYVSLALVMCRYLLFVEMSFDFCLKMSLFTLIYSSPLQYSASPSLLPSLYGHLQRPAGLRCWTCSDGILRSSSSSGSTACCLCPLCCLSEPPDPPWVCLQTAWPSGAPSAHHHPADVPGILRHGQSSFASLMVSLPLFFLCVMSYWTSGFCVMYYDF